MNAYTPYLDWIDKQELSLLQRIKHWVSINTFSTHLKGLTQLLKLLQQAFKPLGGKRMYLKLPSFQLLLADGTFRSCPLGKALVIRKRRQAPIQILLSGHIDTVFAPSSSFQTMAELKPGLWRGPGVADMKGGLAILLTALEAFERSPFTKHLGWEILLTPDEEIGSPGSAPLFKEAATRHQLGLIFEPAFPDGAFVSQRKGSASYTLVIKGRAAHVGRDFSQGRSAVFAMAHLIHHLSDWNQQEDLVVNVADLEGKGPINIVPPLASCRINLRSSDPDILTRASVQLDSLIQQIKQKDGLQIEMTQDSLRPPKIFDFNTQQLFDAYAHCAHELNIPFQVRETGGVCDGNLLAAAGLPNLDTAGAIGGALHTTEEYLILSSLVERAKLATLFLFKLASGEISFEKGVNHDI